MRKHPIEDLALKVVDPVVADKVNALYLAARKMVKEMSSGLEPFRAVRLLESAVDDIERAAP